MLDRIKQYGSGIGKGLLEEITPGIAGGFINELFHQWKVNVAMITDYVKNNRSLWGEMAPDMHRQLGDLAQRVGDLSFITPEFLINSIRKDFPGVASLFLNWPEAQEWLARQIEDLKKQVSSIETV